MMWLQSFHLTFLTAAASLTIVAAISDARSFRIPNWAWMALLGLFPFYILSSPHELAWEQHLGVCALILAIGFALFAGNFAGAGDVKLLAALALWAGPNLVGVLLVVTALAGGLLALGYAMAAWTRQRACAGVSGNDSGIMQALTKVPIPYGVAIAAGGLSVFGMIVEPILF